MRIVLALASFAAAATATATPNATAKTPFRVFSLTTEYLDRPLGVDVPNPRVSWKIALTVDDNGGESGGSTASSEGPRRGASQSSYRIVVSTSPDFSSSSSASTRVGSSLSSSGVWDCGTKSSPSSTLVPLTSEDCSGLALESDAHYYWKVFVTLDDGSTSEGTSSFRTGMLSRDDWDENATWITGGMERTLLRTTFDAPAKVASHATLFISGIGYHEAYLNGAKVGDRVLDNGWTDYRKRVWYSTHDVTDLLVTGGDDDGGDEDKQNNAIGVSLGNGWWSCGPPPGSGEHCWGDSPPQLLLQLNVDGKPVLITHSNGDGGGGSNENEKDGYASLPSWTSSSGPILYNSLYNGETYDGRIAEALEGWTTPDFDDSSWTPAIAASSVATNATLSSQLFEPIRHTTVRAPVSIHSPKPGMQIFDFGQNQAGVVRLKSIVCDRGSNVTIRHAEVLMHPPYGPKDGTLYVDNLKAAKSTDVYICRGDPEGESYVPTFTQHGFRYAEVTGLPFPLRIDQIEAVELHTDVNPTSSVAFSLPLLNDVHRIVVAGQRSNLMSVPTDCPNRNERLGWMGDAALTAEEASLNFGMGAFYSRWLMQIEDAQNDDGSVPNYVPALVDNGGPGAPNWQSAFPLVVWTLLEQYGDIDVPSRHHDGLVKYYEHWEAQYDTLGVANFTTGFGDWVPPPPHRRADFHLTGAFAFLRDLRVGAEIFERSSHPDAGKRSEWCSALAAKVAREYHEVFYDKDNGYYGSGLQSEQAMALAAGVVLDALKERVLSYLVNDVQTTNDGHLTTGIVGARYLLEVLSDMGRSDVALSLALQTTYPSWGYMLHNSNEPATTVWEIWNADVTGAAMNSRNHIMFGSVGGWMYRRLAGIQPTKAGYAEVAIEPKGQGMLNLTHSDARVVTPYGDVLSSWRMVDEGTKRERVVYTHSVTVPPGAVATVTIPTRFPSSDGGGGFGTRGKARASDRHEDVSITEGGTRVWGPDDPDGEFVPPGRGGVDGVLSGERVADGRDGDGGGDDSRGAVRFRLLSGRYEFAVAVVGTTERVGIETS